MSLRYRPLATEAGRLHVCAHRGHSAGAPENTIPALEAAAALGATAAEIDVMLTRDEAIVLLHDETLERTTDGAGRVAAHDLADIRRLDAGAWFEPAFAGTPMPTLGEALAAARRLGLGLHVEIKERQRPAVLIERLARFIEIEDAVGDLLAISFDHVSLVRLRERLPAIRTELITHARHVDPAAIALRAGAASVAIEWDMFAPEDADALHDAGVAVRLTVPKPGWFARRAQEGFGDRERLSAALAAHAVDILAGDDTAFLARLAIESGAG
jgi:glycerophosphoryl diester phosphodiesterase